MACPSRDASEVLQYKKAYHFAGFRLHCGSTVVRKQATHPSRVSSEGGGHGGGVEPFSTFKLQGDHPSLSHRKSG